MDSHAIVKRNIFLNKEFLYIILLQRTCHLVNVSKNVLQCHLKEKLCIICTHTPTDFCVKRICNNLLIFC
jgi:hypothetical protein